MRVMHPRPQFGRQKFIGVEFVDGVAVLEDPHPEVVASLLQHGFTVEDEPAPGVEPPAFEQLADDTEKVSKPRSQAKRLAAQQDFAAKHVVPLSPDEE